MRLDKYLFDTHKFSSRSSAQDAIRGGLVKVNDKIITKCSYELLEADSIIVLENTHQFASRGGTKLYHALNAFKIDLKEKNVLDVGASTGGFSDVCLQCGANHVYAVDVGKNQLIKRLKDNEKVSNMEELNAKKLTIDMFNLPIQFICMDVSFISIKQIANALIDIGSEDCDFIFLIKPQFEVGRHNINKNGIVKDLKIHKGLLKDMISYFIALNLGVEHLCKSSIKGRGGNQEYLIHLTKVPNTKYFDIDAVVAKE